MLGAIIGDIVGSIYEFNNIKTKDFELFGPGCCITDDTVCTVAVADGLLNKKDSVQTLVDWCRRYPGMGYGDRFTKWFDLPWQEPYNSFGNGAAMRISAVAFLASTMSGALADAKRITAITHNHPEGIKGACATVHAIYMAKCGASPSNIEATMASLYGYDVSRSVDEIRPDYAFNESCQQTVPQALTCALRASSFEDAIRNAISIGGDSDTIGAIAGALAEARFQIPDEIKVKALSYLPEEMRTVVEQFYEIAGKNQGMVWHCGADDFLLKYQCPMEWGMLQATSDAKVRHCQQCARDVHFCETPEAFVQFSKSGECVALPLAVQAPRDRSPGLGMPRPWSYDLEQYAKEWWKQVEPYLDVSEYGRQIYNDHHHVSDWPMRLLVLREEAERVESQSPDQ